MPGDDGASMKEEAHKSEQACQPWWPRACSIWLTVLTPANHGAEGFIDCPDCRAVYADLSHSQGTIFCLMWSRNVLLGPILGGGVGNGRMTKLRRRPEIYETRVETRASTPGTDATPEIPPEGARLQLLLFRPQGAQQPVGRLPVEIVVFPVGEVPDVVGVLEQRRSACLALHHGVVDPDGEEDRLALRLALPGGAVNPPSTPRG